MKKIAAVLISLFLSMSSYAALPTTASDFHVNVPLLNPAFEFGATALFLEPSTFHEDYAIIFPALFTDGHYKSIRPGFDLGYQFYIGYLFPCSGADARLTYTEYFQKASDRSVASEGIIVPGLVTLPTVLIPALTGTVSIRITTTTVVFPGIIIRAREVPVEGTLTFITATEEHKQQAWDFDVGQYIDIDNFVRLRFITGLRFARLKNKYNTHFAIRDSGITDSQTTVYLARLVTGETIPLPVTTTITLDTSSNFEFFSMQTSKFAGFGPHLGIGGTFYLGGGFGLSANFTGALLIGDHRGSFAKIFTGEPVFEITSITSTSTSPEVEEITLENLNLAVGDIITGPLVNDVVDFNDRDRARVVPNLEGKVAINYTYQMKHCRTFNVELGYYVNHYFNAVDRFSEVALTQPELVTGVQTMDLSFSGPYITVEFAL